MNNKIMKKFNVALVIFCLSGFGFIIQSQNCIPASGGNASGGGTVSYTLGQILYTTNISITSGSMAQGVQQPYEISLITTIEGAEGITLACSVYPNPVIDLLTLKVENYEKKSLAYKLLDSKGRLLESKNVTGHETIISMTNLFSNIYFLNVLDSQKEIKTFKIIKTK